jgi:hypothetical protein
MQVRNTYRALGLSDQISYNWTSRTKHLVCPLGLNCCGNSVIWKIRGFCQQIERLALNKRDMPSSVKGFIDGYNSCLLKMNKNKVRQLKTREVENVTLCSHGSSSACSSSISRNSARCSDLSVIKHWPGPSACDIAHKPQYRRSREGALAFIFDGGRLNGPSSGSALVALLLSLSDSTLGSENSESFEAPDLGVDFDPGVFCLAGVP